MVPFLNASLAKQSIIELLFAFSVSRTIQIKMSVVAHFSLE